MRVLLNLPTALAEKVKKESQQKEIRKAIIFALEEYLRKKKMTWSQIGIALNKIEGRNYDYKTNQDKLQQAYKDFPLK